MVTKSLWILCLFAAPSQEDVLAELSRNTQHSPPPVRLEIETVTDYEWSGWNVPLPQNDQQLHAMSASAANCTTIFYRDRERSAFTYEKTSTFNLAADNIAHRSTVGRHLWDGKNYFRYRGQSRADVTPKIYMERSKDKWKWSKARLLQGNEVLEATFLGDVSSLAEHLENSERAAIHERLETVNGSECLKVSFANSRGEFTVWLDPDHSYLMRKAHVLKSSNHVAFEDDEPISKSMYRMVSDATPSNEREYAWGESIETWVDDVTIEKFGDHHFVSSAMITTEIRYDRGRLERSTTRLNIKNIALNPDFDSMGAFDLYNFP